jgi:hypothetical protein
VVQQLPERDGGSVGAPLTVAEPVDDVPRKVTAGRIVEPALAAIGQHQQGGGGHHLGDAGDPEGHLGVQSGTVIGVGRRSPSPSLGPARRLDPEKAPVNPWEQPARGGLGDQPIQHRRPAYAVNSRVAHGVLRRLWIGTVGGFRTEAKSLTGMADAGLWCHAIG